MKLTRKPPVGARPGTLAIHTDAPKPRLRLFVYDAETLETVETPGLPVVKRHKERPQQLWLDVQGLGDEKVLRDLAGQFSIHPLALEDIVNAPVRPKAEPYEDNLLIVARMPRAEESGEVISEQVCLVVGEDYVLSFQQFYGDTLEPVRVRLRNPSAIMRRSKPDYLAYALLDAMIDGYYPILEEIGDRLERLEDEVLTSASPETLRELTQIKGALLGLRRAVFPLREAVNSLIRDENPFVGQEVRVYLRDTYDHVVQTLESIEMSRELVSSLMNTYLSVVSNRMNEVMKTLTIVASIFVPLTFMAGIYGMNFEYMPELHVRWAYPTLMGAMGTTAAGMLVYFWRKGWLSRR